VICTCKNQNGPCYAFHTKKELDDEVDRYIEDFSTSELMEDYDIGELPTAERCYQERKGYTLHLKRLRREHKAWHATQN
jgi:hypothetical protein